VVVASFTDQLKRRPFHLFSWHPDTPMSNINPSLIDVTGSAHPDAIHIKLPEDTKPKSFKKVLVRAPARLHLGFLDLSGALGRRYGSIGLAIDAPKTKLTVAMASSFSAHGPESDRALLAAHRYGTTFAPDLKFCVEIERAIPAHAGLGSGTQLALAIGAGILKLSGQSRAGAEIGALAERGARSAIGIAAFEQGGFIVDGGKPIDAARLDSPPPVIMRAPFPEAWRAILIIDDRAEGVHGDRETAAFASLPAFKAAQAAHICHLVMMKLAPALHETDISGFGAALTEIQEIVGAHFAAAQGGSAWSSAAVGRMAAKLRAAGAVGIGQSSWGPTGFAFLPTEDAAKRLYHSLVGDAKADGLRLLIVKGRNSGGTVESLFS
jgi:beta-ribofuranosylaminobenzene 5'-phosphate synthase